MKNNKMQDEALETLRKCIESDPCNAEYYYYAGNFYFGSGEEKKAIEMWEESLELNPHDVQTQKRLFTSYIENGEYGKALDTGNRIMDLGGMIDGEAMRKLEEKSIASVKKNRIVLNKKRF